MADFAVLEFAEFERFARQWGASSHDNRLYWYLLDHLGPDELLIRIPEWLAEEKIGYVEGATPQTIIGRIDRETAKAIRLADAVGAAPLLKTALSIHELEQGEGTDRNEWLDQRLAEHRKTFARREGAPRVSDPWFPKSQIEIAVRRVDPPEE